jgi:monoterpene epsilon-lactone hydrolase
MSKKFESKAFKPLSLHGSIGLRAISLLVLARSALSVVVRRLLRGPQRPLWTLAFEIATHFFQAQDFRVRTVAASGDIARCRAIADSLVFHRPALNEVRIESERRLPGAWFIAPRPGPTVLYFHGGGYSFYPRMTDNIVAAVAMATAGRTFIPHYPLAPEHPFPAQLDAARKAYAWLLDSIAPSQIVFAGDSAGGHLALMLLLTLNDLPKPAAAVAISPWTDPRNGGASITANSAFDWMSPAMSNQLARWAGPEFTENASLTEWPDTRDLASLPPLLIHAGEAEIARDMIEQFCARATAAGAPVTCRVWPDMNHNFHGFGEMMPQSRDALAEIGAFAAAHCR